VSCTLRKRIDVEVHSWVHHDIVSVALRTHPHFHTLLADVQAWQP